LARLQIPEIFKKAGGRVLYLDADILILNDLLPLWRANLEGGVLGAALDKGIFDMIKRDDVKAASLPTVARYFNSGVLLIDVDRCQEFGLAEKAMSYLKLNTASPFSDQDALNAACDGEWARLENKWNWQIYPDSPCVSDLPSTARPNIVHFVTSNKPWLFKEINVHAALYDSVRNQTRFYRKPLPRMIDAVRIGWALCRRAVRNLLGKSFR
jgi:lipopolysaccharide biosynthesis glycosyltransferase